MPVRIGGFNSTDIVGIGKPLASFTRPFTVTIAGSQDKGYKIKVYPGSIQGGLIPTNIYSEFPYSPSDSSITYVKLNITTNGSVPTSATIQVDSSPISQNNATQTNAAPSTWMTYIAAVSGKNTVYQIRSTNFYLQPRVVALKTKTTTNPFQDIYDRIITWTEIG
jgi:hypothetical protein